MSESGYTSKILGDDDEGILQQNIFAQFVSVMAFAALNLQLEKREDAAALKEALVCAGRQVVETRFNTEMEQYRAIMGTPGGAAMGGILGNPEELESKHAQSVDAVAKIVSSMLFPLESEYL